VFTTETLSIQLPPSSDSILFWSGVLGDCGSDHDDSVVVAACVVVAVVDWVVVACDVVVSSADSVVSAFSSVVAVAAVDVATVVVSVGFSMDDVVLAVPSSLPVSDEQPATATQRTNRSVMIVLFM